VGGGNYNLVRKKETAKEWSVRNDVSYILRRGWKKRGHLTFKTKASLLEEKGQKIKKQSRTLGGGGGGSEKIEGEIVSGDWGKNWQRKMIQEEGTGV